MSNTEISIGLDNHLESSVAGKWPIAFENSPYDPTGGVYLEVDLLPAQTDNFTIQGKAKRLEGIYQVTVVTPIGEGSQIARRAADEIAEYFANDTRIDLAGGLPPLYVVGHPSVFDGIKDEVSYRVPVSIPYMLCV